MHDKNNEYYKLGAMILRIKLLFFCTVICGCQTIKHQSDTVAPQHYVENRIHEYENIQNQIYSEYKETNDVIIKQRNQYIISELWKENKLINKIKTEITKNKYKLILLQVYGDYQAPNFVVRCNQEFPFPSIWTKYTSTLIINDNVIRAPEKPQKEHSMVLNNSTIISRIGGIVNNGDVVQYKILIQQFQDKQLLWQTVLFTNKVIAQGLKTSKRSVKLNTPNKQMLQTRKRAANLRR